jgi:acyl-CoA thioester hydrolase
MAFEHVVQRQVVFSETDTAGFVHFTNLLRYAEDTEHSFLRSLGLSVITRLEGRTLGWPRVATDCRFLSPLHFEDTFETHVMVKKIGTTSITYVFEIRRTTEGSPPTVVARGQTTAVCVEGVETGSVRAVSIPEQVTEKLSEAPLEKLFDALEQKD